MFSFRGFSCQFAVQRDLYGNKSIAVIDAEKETLLYQLTTAIPCPLPENQLFFEVKPFLSMFLAELEQSGLLEGKLTYQTVSGRTFLTGRLASISEERRLAATA